MVDSRPPSPKTPPLRKRRRSRSRTRTPTRTPISRKPSTRSRSRTPNSPEKGKAMPKKKLMMEESNEVDEDVFFISDDSTSNNNDDLEEVKSGRKQKAKAPLATMGARKQNVLRADGMLRDFDLDLMNSSEEDGLEFDDVRQIGNSSKIIGETSMQSTSNSTNLHSATFSESFDSPLPSIPTNSMDGPQSSKNAIFNQEFVPRTPTPTMKKMALNLTPKGAVEIVKRRQQIDEIEMNMNVGKNGGNWISMDRSGGIINSSKQQQNNQKQQGQGQQSTTSSIGIGQNVAGKSQKLQQKLDNIIAENAIGRIGEVNGQNGLIGNRKTTNNIQSAGMPNNSSNQITMQCSSTSTNVLLSPNGIHQQQQRLGTVNLNNGNGIGNSGEKTQQIGQFVNQAPTMNVNNQQMAEKSSMISNQIPMPNPNSFADATNIHSTNVLLGSGNGIQQQGVGTSSNLNNGNCIGNQQNNMQNQQIRLSQLDPQSFTAMMQLATETLRQQQQLGMGLIHPQIYPHQMPSLNPAAATAGIAMNPFFIPTRPPTPTAMPGIGIGGQIPQQFSVLLEQHIRQCVKDEFKQHENARKRELAEMKEELKGKMDEICADLKARIDARNAGNRIQINQEEIARTNTAAPTDTTNKSTLNYANAAINAQTQQPSAMHSLNLHQISRNSTCPQAIHSSSTSSAETPSPQISHQPTLALAEAIAEIAGLPATMKPFKPRPSRAGRFQKQQQPPAMEDPKRQEEIDRQIKVLVAKALEVDSAAKSTSQKDQQQKGRGGAKSTSSKVTDGNGGNILNTSSSSSLLTTSSSTISSSFADIKPPLIATIRPLPARAVPPTSSIEFQQANKRKTPESDSSDEEIRAALRLLKNPKKKKLSKRRNQRMEEDEDDAIQNPLQPSTSSLGAPKTGINARNNKSNEQMLPVNQNLPPPPPIHRSTSPIPSTSNNNAAQHQQQENGKDDDVIFEDSIDRFKWTPHMKKEHEVEKEKGTEEVHTISSSDEDDHNYLWNWNGRWGIGGGMQQQGNGNQQNGIGIGIGTNGNNQREEGELGNSATAAMPTKRLTRGENRRMPERFQPEEFPRRSRSRSRDRKNIKRRNE